MKLIHLLFTFSAVWFLSASKEEAETIFVENELMFSIH